MKILVAHNFYQHPGGEDAVCSSEIAALRSAGHRVIEYTRNNEEILNYSLAQKAGLFYRASWSSRSHRELSGLLSCESPDVAHFHNTFPLISPSAYYACRAAGIPVVQTLHNYRLLCPGGNLFRDGRVCEDCVSRSPIRSIAHACYRESRAESAAVAGMLSIHNHLRTWSSHVDLFLVHSRFARGKFADAGFDAQQLHVKPNFLTLDPGVRQSAGESALFLGRLSLEKGPHLLLRAWSQLPTAFPLEIVGDGPLRSSLESECARLGVQAISFSGWLEPIAALERLHAAKFLIVPSVCYEGFPMVVAQAFACGVPVIAAGHGGLAEIVRDGLTGLHFKPGDASSLAAKVAWAWAHPLEMERMGRAARVEFEAQYSSGPGLANLEAAYELALRRHRDRAQAATLSVSSRIFPEKTKDANAAPSPPDEAPAYKILGVRVNAVQIPGVISRIEKWIALRDVCRYITVTDMHSLMQAHRSSTFKAVLQGAALTVPDGFPLVWLARRKGFPLRRRVYGPELMERFCQATSARGFRHFFYGGAPGVAEELAARFAARFPGLQVAGVHSPPFRLLSPEEDAAEVSMLNAACADIIWVGLGAPKQERWMFDHQNKVNPPVLIGVGAAFDFHAGRIRQAPSWMRERGLEWLFRLFHEPARLWRRYLIYGAQFVALVFLEAIGIRKFS